MDGQGRIIVADRYNSRVQIFNSEGGFLSMLGVGVLKYPVGISLAADCALVYVSDTGNHRLVVYDKAGNLLGQFGGFGAANGTFHMPTGPVWDLDNSLLYLADTHNNRIEVFGAAAPSLVASVPPRPERLLLPAPTIQAIQAIGGSAGHAGTGTMTEVGPPLNLNPNPFDPRHGDVLAISAVLPRAMTVGIVVADKHGQPVKRWTGLGFPVGEFQVTWDGMGDDGRVIQAGICQVTLTAVDAAGAVVSSAVLDVTNRGGHVPGSGGRTPRGRGKR